jgi:crossover junction endodeoxyribonuclease RuvC
VTPAPKTAQRPKREAILGIDPGSLVTGWGVIEAEGNRLHYTAHGIIATSPAHAQAERLKQIYRGIQEVIRRYRPVVVSLEKVFFSRNVQSALKLGQARGMAMLAAAESEIPLFEYSATEIKLGVVGYGHATKEQIQKMVTALLSLRGALRTDAADALAAAICHIHRRTYQARIGEIGKPRTTKSSWRDYAAAATKR